MIATPTRPSDRSGNHVTARRWARHLGALGHRVEIVGVDEVSGTADASAATELDAAEALIALHARRCGPAALRWSNTYPDRPLLVALTGTDLYHDLPEDPIARATVRRSNALIALQTAAIQRLAGMDPRWAAKTHVIEQSVDDLPPRRPPLHTTERPSFRVVVLAHLRSVKDPLMSARAVRRLPDSSGITVHHAGAALDPDWQHAARLEASLNPRWIWHGELDAAGALDLLSTAAVLACTSASEGGANVVTEAIAMGVPVVGTRIDGNTGLLGDAYPGLVPVGDDETLARLLLRLERSPSALAELQRHVDQLGPLTSPDRERAALGAVVEALLAPAN